MNVARPNGVEALRERAEFGALGVSAPEQKCDAVGHTGREVLLAARDEEAFKARCEEQVAVAWIFARHSFPQVACCTSDTACIFAAVPKRSCGDLHSRLKGTSCSASL